MGGVPSPGSQSLAVNYCTDFASSGIGGLIGLRQMIEDADPAGLDRISDRWRAIHDALVQAQQDLQSHARAATDHWSGTAAEGFAGRADELCQSLGNGASYALKASTGTSMAAAALREAQADMPSVPGTFSMFARWATSETSDAQFQQDLDSGMSRAAAIRRDGGQLSLLEERHQEAIVVMQTLEGHYESAAAVIGQPAPVKQSTNWSVYPPPPSDQPSAHGSGSAVRGPDEVPADPGQATSVGARGIGGNPTRLGSTSAPQRGTGVELDGAAPSVPSATSAAHRTGSGARSLRTGSRGGPRPRPKPPGLTDARPVSREPTRRTSDSSSGREPESAHGARVGDPQNPEVVPSDGTVPADSVSAPGDVSPTARTQVPAPESGRTRTQADDAAGGDGMPYGPPGAGGSRIGRAPTRRQRTRRYATDADESFGDEGHPLGDGLIGQDGINELFTPPTGELYEGVHGGQAPPQQLPQDGEDGFSLPVHTQEAVRSRRTRPRRRWTAGGDLPDSPTGNPPVIE